MPSPNVAVALAPALLCLVTGVAAPGSAAAAPRLRCQLDQGGETQTVEFAPVRDPYSVRSIDVRGNFRFKAVVIGDERRVEYIRLYTSYVTGRQPMLLHDARYAEPVAAVAPDPAALTGAQAVYSPVLGRELKYRCALFEVTP